MACDPATLLNDAVGLTGANLSKKQLLAIIAQQLCVLNGGSTPSTCGSLAGDSSPVGAVTPEFVGQLYNQNNGEAFFYSTGLTNADWTEIDTSGEGLVWGPGAAAIPIVSGSGNSMSTYLFALTGETYTTFSFGQPTTVAGVVDFKNSTFTSLEMRLLSSVGGNMTIFNCANVVTLSFPALATVGGFIDFDGNTLFTTLLLPSLVTVGDELDVPDNPVLSGLSLPSLTTVASHLDASNCPSLDTFSAPLWLPTNGKNIMFTGDSLDAASVNHILARAVANPAYVSGTINVSGGTNAAPTGQGILDKATLIGRGCTVTTN